MRQGYHQLAEQRRRFDETLCKALLGHIIVTDIQRMDGDFFEQNGMKPLDHVGEMYRILREEGKAEFETRRRSIRNYISCQGLSEHTENIIYGLNKSVKRVTVFDPTFQGTILQHRSVLHHDSSAMLQFGLEYVDRWKIYNELFKDTQ